MTGYIKDPYAAIFIGPRGCGKSYLVLNLAEQEYNKHYDYIIIICPTLGWNKAYHAMAWIKYDDKGCLIEPKGNLCQ